MKARLWGVVLMALATAAMRASAARTLDFDFIDVEGGQSTLIVTPAGQSLLVDSGYGGFDGRDPDRIMTAVHDAGLTQIDFLLTTHFHGDHVGGAPALSRRIPIHTFIDYGEPIENGNGARRLYDAYSAVRANGRSIQPKPGDRMPLKGLEVDVVSVGGSLITKPLSGAGTANPACATLGKKENDETENPRSLGFRLKFGRFLFVDLGDLSGLNLVSVFCPANLVGHADLYLVTHHGNSDTNIPAVLAALHPRVALLNNGVTKGGSYDTFRELHQAAWIEDVWQLHKSQNTEENFPDDRIANLDDSTGYGIKVSASENGSFTVTNNRTGETKRYAR
ncbi:MAG: MBL fold metallo-hydrolase [Acidobacteria bacterium]|nr:MBL fold metallo-hydrolase [Acidobacteriota bacterium]